MPLSSLSRSRLLLVEDDRMVRETIVLMLEDDYEVLLSDSIKAALAYLHTPEPAPIEVILLDCLLPDGNLPVVLISGDPRQAEAMDPSRQFLPKPFTQATLLKILDTARG
jgi:DNA-binding NtrC family response regulator